MQYPNSTGAIIRKTAPMLRAPGSIWQEASEIYRDIYGSSARIRDREMQIRLPNKSVLKFSAMLYEKDKEAWKGSQLNFCLFDEATDFTESQVIYLSSRLRSTKSKSPRQLFALTNPSYDSFFREWIQDFYLDENGIPIQEKAGVMRWFFRRGNTMIWYNSLEEAEAVHGKGDSSGITSFTFIPFSAYDNPVLLKSDPGYITRLKSLPRVEKEKLLDGSWFARLEQTGLVKREWCEQVDAADGRATTRVRSWDIATTKPSEVNPNPDWTAGVLISKNKETKYYTVENAVRIQDRPYVVEQLIFDTAKVDGHGVMITIPADPNAAAKFWATDMQRRLAEKGYNCRLVKPVHSKVTRFSPFSSLAHAGWVRYVKGDWNKAFWDELEVFDGEGKHKDDQCDCVSDAIYTLNRTANMPTSMNMPDLSARSSSTNPFKNNSSAPITIPTFEIQHN